IQTIVNANRPLLDKPKVLNISPTFSNTSAIKNETPKVTTPLKTNQNNKTLTRLYASVYHQLKQKWTLLGQTQTRPLGIAVFRYVFEEIKKEERAKPKPSTVLARMKNIPYPITPNKDKTRITGHFIVNNTQTVTIHFDSETPIKKKLQVLPRLENISYTSKHFKSDIKLTAKPRQINKNATAILKFDIEAPLVRKSDIFKKIYPSNYKWEKDINSFSKPNPIAARKTEKVVLKFENFEEIKKKTLTFIQAQNYPKRVAYAIRIPQPKPTPTNLGTAIFRYNTTPSVKPTTPTIPTKPTKLSQDVAEFTTTIENNNEKTEVAVYFEGKTGKKYPNATPEIIFKDLSSQGTNVSFIRKVNGGNPIPQSIKEGQYDVVVKGYNDLFVKNVTIVPNKLNKVIINVSEGTLSFAYMGNRSRPMEYKAVVNRRFSNSPDVLQNCTQKLPYEPGTYYVEINTLPASKFSIDMSFGALYELQIPEPGYLQITNKTPYGNIFIQYEHGDKFETFYNMKISGSLSTQKIEILPGRYKIIFPVNPQMPQMGTKTIDVRITSNQINEVELQ
ncbi:MAG: hypothetical protein IT215_03920, partial [Chitinophagaceae bacterium]|nr:hypothetical protein [Chitinophagaceae bacterium]